MKQVSQSCSPKSGLETRQSIHLHWLSTDKRLQEQENEAVSIAYPVTTSYLANHAKSTKLESHHD